MKANDPIVAADAVQALADAQREIREHLARCDDDTPASASPAKLELTDPSLADHRQYLETAYSQGDILIRLAEDHLVAFLKIVDTLQQAFAPWTCVRAILEASAIAAWLLDDNISAEERVKRSFSFRYESMEQELKFLRAKKYNEYKIKARIAEVESWAVKLGFAKVKNRKGERIGIGLVFPKMIEVTRNVLDMEDAYRILSGMAHGRSWVVNQLGLRRVGQSTSDFGNPLVHLKQQMPAIGMVYLSQLALSAYGQAVESQCRLFGWEPAEIERITQSVDEVIQKAAARLAP